MKGLMDLSPLSCISHNANHKFEQILRSFERSNFNANFVNPPSLGIFTDKRCLDRKRKLQWTYTKLTIIASTLPVITAGNLNASRLQWSSILFMSTSTFTLSSNFHKRWNKSKFTLLRCVLHLHWRICLSHA